VLTWLLSLTFSTLSWSVVDGRVLRLEVVQVLGELPVDVIRKDSDRREQ